MGVFLSRETQLRLRRLLLRRRRATETSAERITQQIDSNFVGHFSHLKRVRRFALGWLGLSVLLILVTVGQTINLSYAYQTLQPVAGGAYHEGMVGTFSTANPLYATGAFDTAVSKLVFAGLLKYDNQNRLTGDLATGYTLNDNAKIYTVKLRSNLKWHDGRPLTADDVLFTFQALQNPDARSVLQESMEGVSVAKVDSRTITFTLSSALSSFPSSLTLGILPKHILEQIPPAELRTASFNTVKPIGAGPFVWRDIQITNSADDDETRAVIALDAFEQYHGGKPQLNRFVIHAYDSSEQLIRAFKKREVRAIAGLKSLPKDIKEGDDGVRLHSFQSTAAVMTFFNTTAPSPVSDPVVRRALLLGTSRRDIIQELQQPLHIVRQPILDTQFAFDEKYQQPLYDKARAEQLLDTAGWKLASPGGMRLKDGHRLAFRLYAEDTPDNRIVTNQLKKQWRDIGVDADTNLQATTNFRTTVETRSYDAVLYGISIGNDPDVYAYWHSSQVDDGMNFSNYQSKTADTALEAARVRQDEAQRKLKYEAFLKAWYDDVPAIAMYQPRIYYLTRGETYGLTEHILNTDADRYYSVSDWQINVGLTHKR